MSGQSVKIKRSELYRRVWSTPVVRLAREFGISDVALAKRCRAHNIPKPGVGYWAKLEHGKAVKQTPLPKSEDGDYEITITAFERHEIRTKDSDPGQISRADQLIRKINMDEDAVPTSDSVENARKFVKMAYRSLRNARRNESGILTPRVSRCLPIHVSASSLKRAVLIMDSLLALLERYDLSVDPEHLDRIIVLGHPITFGVYELLDSKSKGLTKAEMRERDMYPWRHDRPEYEYTPNGRLSLVIDERDRPPGLRRTWSDGMKQKVEGFLKKFLLSAVELSVHKETMKRRNERWERERREEYLRRAELSQKKWEEQKRVEGLEREVSRWHKSQQIRSYISHVHDMATRRLGGVEKGSQLDVWIRWARRRADIVDPLVEVDVEPWEVDFTA